jgi:hypothetical protein
MFLRIRFHNGLGKATANRGIEMGGNSYDEKIQEVIITCPKCGKHNRLRRQMQEVGYRCGNHECRAEILSPFDCDTSFASKVPYDSAARRKPRKFIYQVAIIVAIGLIVLAAVLSRTKTVPVPVTPASSIQHAPVALSIPEPRFILQPRSPLKSSTIIARPLPAARFLPNGSIIKNLYRSGDGVLKIDNGTARDAVIKLVDEKLGRVIVEFYVRAGNLVAINQIPDGKFTVMLASGEDWDPEGHKFTRDKSFAKFDKLADYVTIEQSEGDQVYRRSHEITLTLHKVPYGNATTSKISEQEFMKY